MKHKFAIIVSRFNESVTDKLADGALNRFLESGVSRDDITLIQVPGAVEIPLTAKLLAQTRQYSAIVTLGAIIRGETGHYDFVCEQVSQGCQRVMLDNDIPVIFGVLTTENEEQAFARAGGAHGNKGKDAADAALEMVGIIEKIAANDSHRPTLMYG